MSFVFRVFLFFSFALLLTRTSIYSTSKLLRLLRLWSDFIWIHSFHQRIKQELKKVTRYCEVDNIRCKVVFDKCTKFVFFSIRGFYVLLHGLIHLLDPVISRFFSERSASSLQICCQDVHYFPFRWFSVRVFFFSTRCYDCWCLYLF